MTCGSNGKGREIGKRGDVFVRFFYRVREVLWRRNIFFLGLFFGAGIEEQGSQVAHSNAT